MASSDDTDVLIDYELLPIPDDVKVLTLAAFIDYAAPLIFFQKPISDVKVAWLGKAREILFPNAAGRLVEMAATCVSQVGPALCGSSLFVAHAALCLDQ
jgi:hypothetical protein